MLNFKISFTLFVLNILLFSCSKDDANTSITSSFLSHTVDENNSSAINIKLDFNKVTLKESWINNELDYHTRHGALIDEEFIYTSLSDGIAKLKRSNGEIVWSLDLEGSVKGNIAISGDIIFASADEYFYSIKKSTGESIWGKDLQHPIDATPITFNKSVIIPDISKGVYSFDIQTGTLNWFYPIINGSSSKPVIIGSTLYLGDNDGAVHSINASTGKSNWIFEKTCNDPTGCPSIYTPIVHSSGNLFFGSTFGIIYCLGTDGTLKWQYKHTERVYYESASISGNNLILAGRVDGFGNIVAIVSVDASNGTFNYLKDVGKTWISNPLIVNDTNVLVGSSLGLNNLNLNSGDVIWTFAISGSNGIIVNNCDSQIAVTEDDIIYNAIGKKLVRLQYN